MGNLFIGFNHASQALPETVLIELIAGLRIP
jgi:hypothetical protein